MGCGDCCGQAAPPSVTGGGSGSFIQSSFAFLDSNETVNSGTGPIPLLTINIAPTEIVIILIHFEAVFFSLADGVTTFNDTGLFTILLDGNPVNASRGIRSSIITTDTGLDAQPVSIKLQTRTSAAPGAHTIEVMWTSAGTVGIAINAGTIPETYGASLLVEQVAA